MQLDARVNGRDLHIVTGANRVDYVTRAATAIAGGDSDTPITGPALQQASDAALAHIGQGTVTDTEVGDEESLYEVEITLPDGSEVDVQLDESFTVVGSEADQDGPNDSDSDGQ